MNKEATLSYRVAEYLKELNLSQIRENYPLLAQKAQDESLSYEEFLHELLEQQCIYRRHKRLERFLRESQIPLEKNMAAFDLKRLTRKVVNQVKELQKGTFVKHTENVLAFGNPGSGKTHLLCALGQELIHERGLKVYFARCDLLVQELLIAKRDLELPRYLKKISRYNVLIIDDLGYVQQNREEMEVLFTLLAERYERGSIMLTSNLPFSQWEKIFKDPMVTAAAIDRLIHHSVILELNVPSYRMANAKKNQGGVKTNK